VTPLTGSWGKLQRTFDARKRVFMKRTLDTPEERGDDLVTGKAPKEGAYLGKEITARQSPRYNREECFSTLFLPRHTFRGKAPKPFRVQPSRSKSHVMNREATPLFSSGRRGIKNFLGGGGGKRPKKGGGKNNTFALWPLGGANSTMVTGDDLGGKGILFRKKLFQSRTDRKEKKKKKIEQMSMLTPTGRSI